MAKFIWASNFEKPSAVNTAMFCKRNSPIFHRLDDVRSANRAHAENMRLRKRIREALARHHEELMALPGKWTIRVTNRDQLVLTQQRYVYGRLNMHLVQF